MRVKHHELCEWAIQRRRKRQREALKEWAAIAVLFTCLLLSGLQW